MPALSFQPNWVDPERVKNAEGEARAAGVGMPVPFQIGVWLERSAFQVLTLRLEANFLHIVVMVLPDLFDEFDTCISRSYGFLKREIGQAAESLDYSIRLDLNERHCHRWRPNGRLGPRQCGRICLFFRGNNHSDKAQKRANGLEAALRHRSDSSSVRRLGGVTHGP